MTCWWKDRGQGPCDGPIDRAHWIPKQRIRREFRHLAAETLKELVWHPAVWSPMCRRHHGDFDSGKLKVAREQLPVPVERYAEVFGLAWSLDASYGPHPEIGLTTEGSW